MEKIIACRKSFTSALLELAKKDKDIVAVATDSRGSVTLTDFAEELPGQFIEAGIAEQDAVGISAGLANGGKKVFCCGPASFYAARAIEQVKVDVAYSKTNVCILGVSGGISYGALGGTHQCVYDIAVMSTFPGLSVFLPSDAVITDSLVRKLVAEPRPAYVRVGRAGVPVIYGEGTEFVPGKAIVTREGSDVTIAATGETVWHAAKAADELRQKGIKARVLDFSSIVPFDREAVIRAARETGKIVTVEEHSVRGGLGSMVAETISENPVPVRILGLPVKDFVHGNSAELFEYYGIDWKGIEKSVIDFLNK
jgi:transketolase